MKIICDENFVGLLDINVRGLVNRLVLILYCV